MDLGMCQRTIGVEEGEGRPPAWREKSLEPAGKVRARRKCRSLDAQGGDGQSGARMEHPVNAGFSPLAALIIVNASSMWLKGIARKMFRPAIRVGQSRMSATSWATSARSSPWNAHTNSVTSSRRKKLGVAPRRGRERPSVPSATMVVPAMCHAWKSMSCLATHALASRTRGMRSSAPRVDLIVPWLIAATAVVLSVAWTTLLPVQASAYLTSILTMVASSRQLDECRFSPSPQATVWRSRPYECTTVKPPASSDASEMVAMAGRGKCCGMVAPVSARIAGGQNARSSQNASSSTIGALTSAGNVSYMRRR